MDLLVALTAVEIIASKFLSSYISSQRIENGYEEKNPLFRFFFKSLKVQHDEWLSFFCTILITGILMYFLNTFYPAPIYQALFVLGGFYATALNLGAAHSSYFQRTNFITRKLLR